MLVGIGGVTFATFVGRTNSGRIKPCPGLFKNLDGIGEAEVPPGDLHLGSSAPPFPAGPAMGINILCLAPTPGNVFGLESCCGEGLGPIRTVGENASAGVPLREPERETSMFAASILAASESSEDILPDVGF